MAATDLEKGFSISSNDPTHLKQPLVSQSEYQKNYDEHFVRVIQALTKEELCDMTDRKTVLSFPRLACLNISYLEYRLAREAESFDDRITDPALERV